MAQPTEDTKFECSMPHANAKVFASAVQCLAKVGKDLILEACMHDDGTSYVTIRTLNDAKTASTVFTFLAPFFETFNLSAAESDKEKGYCRISSRFPLKSCLCAFRSIRNVESFKISFMNTGANHFVVFTGFCKGGLVKRHEFNYEDAEILDASFDRQTASHKMTAWTSLFTGILTHMHQAEEVLFNVHPDQGIRVRSFHQHVDQRTEFSTLKTDIQVDKNDLGTFEIDKESLEASEQELVLTFGLREFKALLQFCESCSISSMALLFNQPGCPFLLTSDVTATQGNSDQLSGTGRTFAAELVMATYFADQHEESEQALSQSTRRTANYNNSPRETKSEEHTEDLSQTTRHTVTSEASERFTLSGNQGARTYNGDNSDDDQTQKVNFGEKGSPASSTAGDPLHSESQSTFYPPYAHNPTYKKSR